MINVECPIVRGLVVITVAGLPVVRLALIQLVVLGPMVVGVSHSGTCHTGRSFSAGGLLQSTNISFSSSEAFCRPAYMFESHFK